MYAMLKKAKFSTVLWLSSDSSHIKQTKSFAAELNIPTSAHSKQTLGFFDNRLDAAYACSKHGCHDSLSELILFW